MITENNEWKNKYENIINENGNFKMIINDNLNTIINNKETIQKYFICIYACMNNTTKN